MAAPVLLPDVPAMLDWLRSRVRGQLRLDSRQVQPGDGFVAWPGSALDGRRFVADALSRGASACLVEASGVADFGFEQEQIAYCAGLKAACGPLAAAWYGEPSRLLDVLAVTGTNGKTSTAWWLAQALNKGGAHNCGLIGTLGIGMPAALRGGDRFAGLQSTGLTTPDPLALQQCLRDLAQQGARYCAIEASSIGLAEHRLDGTRVRLAMFTNFTQDHLDYHGTMQAYWAAKKLLFGWPALQSAVVNLDDPRGLDLAQDLVTQGVEVWTTSLTQPARMRASCVRHGDHGLDFVVKEAGQEAVLRTGLIGQFNVSNVLGVLAALRVLGWSLQQAAQACSGLAPVPGRMECVLQEGQPLLVVDYAHTPDALDKALAALRPMAQARGGRLWCVFGCGGERDPHKRPLMGVVAQKQADAVVVTSDNPRGERPELIISQILLGLSHHEAVHVQADRALAIAETVLQAGPSDVVLIAGKGHETTQEVASVKHPFDDLEHARRALSRRGQAMGAAA